MKKLLAVLMSLLLATSMLSACNKGASSKMNGKDTDTKTKLVSKIISSKNANDKLETTVYNIEYDDEGRITLCSRSEFGKKYSVTYEYEGDSKRPCSVCEERASMTVTTNLIYDEYGFVETYEEIKGSKSETKECYLKYTTYDNGDIKSITNDNEEDNKNYRVEFDKDGNVIEYKNFNSDYEFTYDKDGVKTGLTISKPGLIDQDKTIFEYEYEDGFISEINGTCYRDIGEVSTYYYEPEYEFDEDGLPITITVNDENGDLLFKYQITYIEVDGDVEPNYSKFYHESVFTHLPLDCFDMTTDCILFNPMNYVFSGF